MKDSIGNPEELDENNTSAENEESGNTGTGTSPRLSGRQDALLPISIVGGIVGMLIGTLPAAAWVLITERSFSPFFVLLPLFIYCGIRLFKGCTEKRGFVVTIVLSAVGFYLTLLSCQAALDVLKYKMLFLNLPLVTITMIGRGEAFTGPLFSSAYVFPVLFIALGVMLVYELTRPKQETAAPPEPEPET